MPFRRFSSRFDPTSRFTRSPARSHSSRVSAKASPSSTEEKAAPSSEEIETRIPKWAGKQFFLAARLKTQSDCALQRRQPRCVPPKPDPVRTHRFDRSSDRTGPTARPTALVPMPNVPPFSGPASGARALARAPARAHAPINFGSSKPGLRGSARSALASFANAPVWRSVFGSKVSHGPTT